MKNLFSLLVVFVVVGGLQSACGGGGGGGTAQTPAPTVAGVVPAQGPIGGSTAITITGTGYAAGATVTVGGTAATAVVVVDATSITCLTPAGTAGPATVAVSVGGQTGSRATAFIYNAAPTITSVAPLGPTIGGTGVFVNGTGFVANGAGTNTVTVGGAAATGVVTIDDSTISCVTPPGVAGPADTIVTNTNGASAPLAGFVYFVPIFAAEGGGNPAPASHQLLAVDPQTALTFPIGSIGFGVAGMDFDPATGILYGVTDPGSVPGPRQLITINTTTGAGTAVGPLNDATTFNHIVTDCAFFGGVLYGVTDSTPLPPNLVSINLITGAVAITATNTVLSPGAAFAIDVGNTVAHYMTTDVAPLVTVTVPGGPFTPGVPLNGYSIPSSQILAAGYHLGTLFALDTIAGTPQREILTVNPVTGALTFVGVVPSPYVSAIASPTR